MKKISRALFASSALTILAVIALAPAAAAEPPARQDIVDTAVAAGSFKTLTAALQAADLVGTLKGVGPFTVFAPTDEAFAKLPAGYVADLLKPENKAKLVATLTYHVVSGRVMAVQASKLTSAKTVNGAPLSIRAMGGSVRVNNATVTATDIECINGVIHVIDSVVQLPALRELVRVTPNGVVGGTSNSDHILTFGSPFQLPGLSLAPGTYVFALDRANQTLRVTNAERQPLAWIQTVPMTRTAVTREYAASFGEPVAAGAPRPLTSWFLPNQSAGLELVYQQ